MSDPRLLSGKQINSIRARASLDARALLDHIDAQADAIKALTIAIATVAEQESALVAALRPFADYAAKLDAADGRRADDAEPIALFWPTEATTGEITTLRYGDVRRALGALDGAAR